MVIQTTSLPSVSSLKSCEKSENEIIGGEDSCFYIFTKALFAFSFYANGLSALLNWLIGALNSVSICVWIRLCRSSSRNWSIQMRHQWCFEAAFNHGRLQFKFGVDLLQIVFESFVVDDVTKTFGFFDEECIVDRVQFHSEFTEGCK